MSRRTRWNLIAWGVGCFCAIATATAPDRDFALSQLERLQTNLADIRRALHREDEARQFVFEKTLRETIAAVQQHGLGHLDTIHHYQLLLARFQYSGEYFSFIRTKRTDHAIREMLETVQAIRGNIGVDAHPPSKNLLAHLEELHTAFSELRGKAGVPESLRKILTALNAQLADALALAGVGDGPAAGKVRELYHAVKKSYGALHALVDDQPLSALVSEIIGINDFMGSAVDAERGR